MAEVTREEFDQLAARVTALEGARITPPRTEPETPTAPDPKPGPTKPAPTKPEPTKPEQTKPEPEPSKPTQPAEPAAGLLTLYPPKVNVDGVKYVIEGRATVNEAATLTYFQIAVRGPGANDIGHKPGQVVKPHDIVTTSGHSLRAKAGDYETWVAYSLNGTNWFDGPKATFTITAEAVERDRVERAERAGPRRIALVGHSGLPFNSIVFRQDPISAETFAKWRGQPVDGLLWFTTRQSWNDFKAYWNGKADYLAAGKLVVTSLPHAPQSEGNSMNSKGANDAYRAQQRDLGKWLADNRLNMPNHVLRVDWECNGNWYHWSANRPGGPGALKAAITNFVKNVRAGGATDVKFDLCFNKGPSQAGADYSVFPGAEYIDVIGIDQYDMWSPAFNDDQWATEIRKTPALANLAAFATEHQIMWSIDECGNTHGSGNQGGDNPFYWTKMRQFIEANLANCAWHDTYDHPGAPATLRHDFATNPKSANHYRALWRPGATA